MIARTFVAGFDMTNSYSRKARSHRQILIATGFAVALSAAPSSAWAACSTSGTDPVTLTCATNTTTTNTTNTTSPNPSTSDHLQQFGADLIGQVNTGVTVKGFGLELTTTKPGGAVTFTNNGALSLST